MIKDCLKKLNVIYCQYSMTTLKLLISRVLEADAMRELLDKEKLNEALREIPSLMENIAESVSMNTVRFNQNYVEPQKMQQLPNMTRIIAGASDNELEHIANTVIFIMEKEIFKISKKILENNK